MPKTTGLQRTSALFLAFFLCGASAAMAQRDGFPGRGGPEGHFGPPPMATMGPPGRWWNNPEISQQLALTADQKTKMDSIFNQHRIELIDAVASVEKAEAILDPLISADKPDEAAILAQIGKVAEARANLEKTHARMLLAIRAQLTPDQWAKLKAERPPMRHGDRGGDRGGQDMRGMHDGPGSMHGPMRGGMPGSAPGAPHDQPPAPPAQGAN